MRKTSALAAAILLTTAASAGAQDTVRARITGTIGETSRTPFILGEISGMTLDDSGRVYVSDFQDPHVVVFASGGKHLATIGRNGSGPGEFRAPTGPVIGPDGFLYVRNMQDVSRFTRDPATGLLTRFDSTFLGPGMGHWRSKWPGVVDRRGRVYFPVTSNRMTEGFSRSSYRRFNRDGRFLDTIPVPVFSTSRSSFSSFRVSENSGRMVYGVNMVPFHPLPVWAVTPSGTILSGAADKYEIIETDSAGRVLRTISRNVPSLRIPAVERTDSAKALQRRIDTLPVPLARVEYVPQEVREMKIPETFPFYAGISVTPAGDIWVRRWLPATAAPRTVLDVIGADGVYRHSVTLPVNCAREPGLVVRGTFVACMTIDADAGGESVVVMKTDR